MGPRSNCLWEFWSLGVWWALWSLADAYLLAYTPAPELGTLGILLAVAGVVRLRAWVRDSTGRWWHSAGPKRYCASFEASNGGGDAV